MPTYTYQCSICGEGQEHFLPMSQRKSSVPCECGAEAAQVFDWQGESLVKGGSRPFKLDGACVPIGWEKGNTDAEKQERRYQSLIGERKKAAQANDKQAIKGGIRMIASVPRELMRMRQNQYGKEYLDPSRQSSTELKDQLRSDGLLFKN